MEGFCRGCLLQYNPSDLLQYTEKNRRLFIYSTGLQVKRNDVFTFQLCKQCNYCMKQSCKFKKQCRASDIKFRNFVMLKEDGDDFGSFLKNMEEHLSMRLPMTLGHSTPSYKKEKDDDNESTCTSIRNFMTEILDGEEMAPTEARIIREVIEEEADILDDSLDSHWLDDDKSMGSDIEIEFGSSPFATPRVDRNDHNNTPKKLEPAKQKDLNFLSAKKIIEEINKPRIPRKYDMPILEDMNSNMEFEIAYINQNEIDDNDDKSLIDFNNSIPSEVEDMVTENSISSTHQYFKTELLENLAVKEQMEILDNDSNLFGDASKDSSNVKTSNIENDVCIVINQGVAVKKEPSNEIEYYLSKAEFKRQILSSKKSSKDYHCTIDRHLDIALKNKENVQFSLDQLITSPAVSSRSGGSTPNINNLLFGEKDNGKVNNASTPVIENILFGDKLDLNTPPRYFPQIGQNFNENNILGKILSNEDNEDDMLQNKLSQTEIYNKMVGIKMKKEIKNKENQNEHMDVLEEFLQEPIGTPNIDSEIIDQIIDPDEIKDQYVFKRPMTPPYDKIDLDKCFCKICNKTFGSAKAIKIHFAKIHKYKFPRDPHGNKLQNSRFIICSVCGKGIKGATHFSRHMKTHDMEDKRVRCQCDYCKQYFDGKIGVQTHILKIHMKVKTKKRFVCPTCGKRSSSSSHNKIHQRRHLKEFSLFCKICGKGFYENFALKKHMRTHDEDSRFTCDYCPAVFRCREGLSQHMKRHLGQTYYKCEVCNIEFIAKHHLNKHYTSSKCLANRKNASQQTAEKVTVSLGKGSIDKIKKFMNTQPEHFEFESDTEHLNSTDIDVKESIEAIHVDKESIEKEQCHEDLEMEKT